MNDINEFEKAVNQYLRKDEETGLFDDELIIRVVADGCLSATLNERDIHCEGMSWDKALDVIIAFIKESNK